MPSSATSSSAPSTPPSDGTASLEDDPVTPTLNAINRILAYSTVKWDQLHQEALSSRMGHGTIQLNRLLSRMPSIPGGLRDGTRLRGYPSWKLSSSRCKEGLSYRQGNERSWAAAVSASHPTRCVISKDKLFRYENTQLNGIALAFMGWTYILSSILLEKQGVSIQYRKIEDKDPSPNQFDTSLEVNIGRVTAAELRWWEAVLGPGQNWESTGQSRPPWVIDYKGNVQFKIIADISDSLCSSALVPPSSREAFMFLSKFTSAYNINGQSSLGLAMALTVPLHNQTMSTVELPPPTPFNDVSRICKATRAISSSPPDYDSLAYYMTLSSNPRYLDSALWSIFWEPDIDCNLVTAWYEPVIRVITPMMGYGDLELIAHLFARRRPQLAPLWYGTLACGKTRTFHTIFTLLRGTGVPMYMPMPELTPWLGSPQSFMDVDDPHPYVLDGQVTRADVWRLRHQFWAANPEGRPFSPHPQGPWQPFGSMPINETELAVRCHLQCRRHKWVYSHWTWTMDGQEDVIDPGYRPLDDGQAVDYPSHRSWRHHQPSVYVPLLREPHAASKHAVGYAFRWALTEMEPSGREIYSHPWVQAEFFRRLDEGSREDDPEKEKEAAEMRKLGKMRAREWVDRLLHTTEMELGNLEI